MDEKLVAACQMFLVPAAILFAALAVATREALKTLLCIIGVVISTAWLYRLYRWTGLSDADRNTAFALAYIFFAAAVIAALFIFGCGARNGRTVFSIHCSRTRAWLSRREFWVVSQFDCGNNESAREHSSHAKPGWAIPSLTLPSLAKRIAKH